MMLCRVSALENNIKPSTHSWVLVRSVLVLTIVVLSVFVYHRLRSPVSVAAALEQGDYRQAVALLKEPKLAANAHALATLGNMYYLGLGVEQNFPESARYYSKAAFAGSTAAQVSLGQLYSSGLGVEQDPVQAFAWFNLANNNGNKLAQGYMSVMLSEHMLNFRVVEQLQVDFVTINHFKKLH